MHYPFLFMFLLKVLFSITKLKLHFGVDKIPLYITLHALHFSSHYMYYIFCIWLQKWYTWYVISSFCHIRNTAKVRKGCYTSTYPTNTQSWHHDLFKHFTAIPKMTINVCNNATLWKLSVFVGNISPNYLYVMITFSHLPYTQPYAVSTVYSTHDAVLNPFLNSTLWYWRTKSDCQNITCHNKGQQNVEIGWPMHNM